MSGEREIRPAILVLAAAVLAAVVFMPSLSGAWIYDDHALIEHNPYIHGFAWTRWLSTDFWNVSEEWVRYGNRMMYWRPAIHATYAIDWAIGGGGPLFFHLMNLAWQALVGALAFVVLRRWVGAALPAFAAAVVFAVHPTKAESVAWIAGRTDILCMAFVLIATEGIARRRRGARGGLALEVAATIAAYLCKEQAIVLPVFAAIEEWLATDRPPLDLAALRRMFRAAIPQAAIAIAYLVARTIVMPIGPAHAAPTMPLGDHALSVLETYGRFAALTVAPHDLSVQQGLVHAIDRTPVLDPFYVVLGGIAIVAISGLVIALRKRRPGVAIGLAFFAVTLLPTSNLKSTHMLTLVSERFLYLPLFGIALVGGIAIARATPPWQRRGYAIAAALAIALGALSLSRSSDYRDEETFWAREYAMHPDSGIAAQFVVEFRIINKQFGEALRLLMTPSSDHYDRSARDELSHATLIASVVLRLVPDHDREKLRALDEFCRTLLERDKPLATLDTAVGRITVATTRITDTPLAEVRSRLLALRTEVASRLGDDARAIELAEQTIATCDRCISTVGPAITALAGAGRYDRASAVLASVRGSVDEPTLALITSHVSDARAARDAALAASGPAALRQRATELAALELWGRAYDTLAPYAAEIEQAPRFASAFAELAFRAGEPAVARRILLAAAPTTDVDATFRTWAIGMGWQ